MNKMHFFAYIAKTMACYMAISLMLFLISDSGEPTTIQLMLLMAIMSIVWAIGLDLISSDKTTKKFVDCRLERYKDLPGLMQWVGKDIYFYTFKIWTVIIFPIQSGYFAYLLKTITASPNDVAFNLFQVAITTLAISAVIAFLFIALRKMKRSTDRK